MAIRSQRRASQDTVPKIIDSLCKTIARGEWYQSNQQDFGERIHFDLRYRQSNPPAPSANSAQVLGSGTRVKPRKSFI